MFNKEIKNKLDLTSNQLLECLDFLKELQSAHEKFTDFNIIHDQEYFKIKLFLEKLNKERKYYD